MRTIFLFLLVLCAHISGAQTTNIIGPVKLIAIDGPAENLPADTKADAGDNVIFYEVRTKTLTSADTASLDGLASMNIEGGSVKEIVDTSEMNATITGLPNAREANSDIFVQRSNSRADHWMTDASGALVSVNIHPEVWESQTINVHTSGPNPVAYITHTFDAPYDGTYEVSLSFNHNSDAASADGVYYATFDGQAMDLNDRAGDAEGNNQVLRIEPKEVGPGTGTNITGTGSGQKLMYNMPFYITTTAGPKDLIISISDEVNGVEASIWNVKAKLQFIHL